MIFFETATEIYKNSNDLVFFIFQRVDGRFDFFLTRGPLGNFKMIFSPNKPFFCQEHILGIVKSILNITLIICRSSKINPDYLTQTKVDEILKGLEENNYFNTF